MAMELSLWSSYFVELSPEDAMARLSKNGIPAAELSTEHGAALLARAKESGRSVFEVGEEFRRYLQRLPIKVTQGHLMLGARIVSDPNAIDTLKEWIDLYEAVGVREMVLHIDNYGANEHLTDDEVHAINLPPLRALAEHIRGRDICICLENLVRAGVSKIDAILELLRKIGSDQFAITLDTGHLNIAKTTSQREFILRAGEKLHAIHIADNEGTRDQHLMPFARGTVDFAEVVSALREIHYKGLFNYEIPGETARCPLALRDAKLQFIRQAYAYLMSL